MSTKLNLHQLNITDTTSRSKCVNVCSSYPDVIYIDVYTF